MRLIGKPVTLEWPTPESADELRNRIRYVEEFNGDCVCVTQREFRYNVQQLLALNLPIIIQTRRGEKLGVYTPLTRNCVTLDKLRKTLESLKR